MKKLLFLLISIPLIFGSCEKEEENPPNNNNSSLTIHETNWEVTSFEESYNNNTTQTTNFPCVVCWGDGYEGILNMRYRFEQNNFITTLFVRIVLDNNEVLYDTLNYEYIPQNNIITVNNTTNTVWTEGFINDDLVFNIIEHNSTNLILQQNDNSGNITGYTKTYLTKIN